MSVNECQKGGKPTTSRHRYKPCNPKAPPKGVFNVKVGDKVKGEAWTPARGIKRPVLMTVPNRRYIVTVGVSVERYSSIKRFATSTKCDARSTLMLKGGRESSVAAQKVVDNGSKVRG